MPRILSIWLPQLPLDRRIRLEDPRLEGPFAITVDVRGALRVAYSNAAAMTAGVQAGLPLADARAICPDLLTEMSHPVRENLLLRALWRWADCLSPRVSLDPPDGLLLDISGCAHLFGGEDAMGMHALQRLGDLSVTARIGIADTRRAARALARHGGKPVTCAAPGETLHALKDLPLSALDLEDQVSGDLARTGLTKLGQLYEIRPAELARRFGLGLTKALSAALGQTPDPITPKAADPVYAARASLPEPIGLIEDIEALLEKLAERVCARLQNDHKGARRFSLTVRCVDTGDHSLSIGFARPCFEPAPLLRQFAHPLGQLKVEYGADWFRLVAGEIEPIRLRQMTTGEEARRSDERARLIETLGNRLGFDHVRVFQSCDSHLPEYEYAQVEAIGQPEPRWEESPRLRPIRLFRSPEWLRVEAPGRPPARFVWRRQDYTLHSARGPERLTARWHAAGDMRTRDYWQVQTAEGPRLWLLNYPGSGPAREWYVAGVFP